MPLEYTYSFLNLLQILPKGHDGESSPARCAPENACHRLRARPAPPPDEVPSRAALLNPLPCHLPGPLCGVPAPLWCTGPLCGASGPPVRCVGPCGVPAPCAVCRPLRCAGPLCGASGPLCSASGPLRCTGPCGASGPPVRCVRPPVVYRPSVRCIWWRAETRRSRLPR